MSSRTAAGRKRIRQEPLREQKEQKESGFRGLFSRSKSVTPSVKANIPRTTYPSSPSLGHPHVQAQVQHSNIAFGGDPPTRPDMRVSRSETPGNVRPLEGYQSPTPSNYPPSPTSSSAAGAYPSPETRYHSLPQQQPYYQERHQMGYGAPPLLQQAASTSRTLHNVQGQALLAEDFPQPPAHRFLEASYQPPPPTGPTRPRNGRPLPHNPVTGRPMNPSPYPPEKVPSPATPYPPPIPSPPRSPPPPPPPPFPAASSFASPRPSQGGITSSLLLQLPPVPRATPSPSNERSYEVPSTPVRPALQVTTAASASQGWEGNYGTASRVHNQSAWPSPPPERNIGLAYLDESPIVPGLFGESNSVPSRRPTGFYAADPVSPSRESVAPSVEGQASDHSGYPRTTRSRRSSVSSGSQDKSSPTFVFPGSRSRVKAKVTSTGKTRLNITGRKSKASVAKGRDSDSEAPLTPSLSGAESRPSTSLAKSAHSSSGSSKGQEAHSIPNLGDGLDWPRKMSAATVDTTTTSGSSSSNLSTPGFVYPGGRSRAHPTATPLQLASFKFSRTGKTSRSSGVSSGSDGGGRKRFMGIPLGKKASATEIDRPMSPMAFTLMDKSERTDEDTTYSGSIIGSTTSNGGPAGPEFEAYKAQRLSPEARRQERVQRIKSRIGAYPLDPYDSILLDNDRHTGDLLNRLNGTGCPSFYEYGSDPPATVLDLGCGQGHWVVEAAIAWKGHGTKVTGYDMVDISKVLLPWAIKQGVSDNIRFVRGNFLKQRLPFNDNSFDLVRMSSLTLCITADAWIFVFQEVCRVLTVGGRLELIDDSIIFPYGKPPIPTVGGLPAPSTPQLNMFAPQLDINIPSFAFSTFCIYDDSDHPNPGLGFPEEDEEQDDLLDLYQVKEEGESDVDDAATLSGREPEAYIEPYSQRGDRARSASRPRNRSRTTQTSGRLRRWNVHAATSRDLEALFEHMLTHKFGIHMRPEEFVLELMKDVFGHAREIRSMHLSLAPPEVGVEEDRPRGRSEELYEHGHDRYGSFGSHLTHIPSQSPARTAMSSRLVGTPLSQSPGLVLSPSTFIPMTQKELEIHASKHLRMLLSCKKYLVEHAMEATEDEEIDEDSVQEALWEYEGFLRSRFNHPPDHLRRNKSPSMSDSASTRESILSISSEGQDAVWEYQSDFRQRFAWPLDGAESPTATRSQITPKVATPDSNLESAVQISTPQERPPTGAQADRSSTPVAPVAPPYSRGEMAHVRTFRVYEAIKLDEAFLGSAAR